MLGCVGFLPLAMPRRLRNGATTHEVREFAGHADIRTTEVYFIRQEDDAEIASRRIQIHLAGLQGQ